MALEVEKQQKAEKLERENLPLNCIDSLRYKTDRQKFVIKVYTICAIQVAITVAASSYVLSQGKPMQDWFKEHYYLTWIAIIAGITIYCMILCCKKPARKVPLNYILLFTFTALWSFMVAGFVIWFTPESVAICAAMVLCMFVGLTLYAIFAKTDPIWYMGIAAVLSVAIFPLILFCWFFPSNLLWNLLYLLIIVLTCIYIIWDTKQIMERFSTDDYIIGALMLYVDLIQLFMYVLALFGGGSN